MNSTAIALATVLATGIAATASAQQVTLTMREGRVTLQTQNASVRQVLAEWERQGGVKVVNVDRLAATQPLTLNLIDVPERQALDVVLRGIPGYMAVDRTDASAGASRYDRLVLLARVTTPTATPAAAGRAPRPAETFIQPVDEAPVQRPDMGDVEQFADGADDAEPPMPMAPVVNPYPGGGGAGAPANANGAGSNVLNSGGGANANGQPETQFDYANPQRYFEQMRQQQAAQQQQQQGGQTGAAPSPTSPYPGIVPLPNGTQAPTGQPGATGTLTQPGIAPPPATPTTPQNFNPYNLPPSQFQGNPGGATVTPGATPPVEPDRSKYANPYQPTPSTTRPPE